MPQRYNHLRTLAFRLKPGIALPYPFAVLEFPERWKSPLKELQARSTGRNVREVRLPIDSLNRALRGLVPNLISIAADADLSGQRSWLYSAEPIDSQALFLIVRAWVQSEFPRASESQKQYALSQLRAEDLCWRQTTLDLAEWTTNSNGTAAPQHGDSFILLPDLLAARLSLPDAFLTVGSEQLRFRRAPATLSPVTPEAELISWPPLKYVNGRKKYWYYSVVLTVTVQTVPFQDFPVIHCDTSLRRWVSAPKSYIPGDKETSVYLLTEVPWIEGLPYSNSFQVAPLGWQRVPQKEQTDEESRYRPVWGSQLGSILERLQTQSPFPNLQELINNPESGLNLEGQHSAVIVYRNGIKPQHQVKAGLPPFDRRQLIEEIACLLTEELDLVDMPERVQFSCSSPTNPFLEQTDDNRLSELQVQRRNSIGRVTENQLAVEIWHQSDLIMGALSQAVRECLGGSALAENSSLNLTVNAQPLGAIGSDLQIDSTIRSRKERRRQAILQRGEEIIAQLAPASIPTVALIELGNADQFETDTDPKNALRRGFAQTGRLVQFLSTEHDAKLLHRAQNGFLDVLRQLGVQAAPLQFSPLVQSEGQERRDVSLPNPLHYVGVWLIKQNAPTSATGEVQRVPVMVHMASDSADIQATAPGLDGWLPYREALVAIAKGEARGFSRSQEAIRFIQPTLERDVVPLGDVLLLCHAQNLGCAWSWLYNRQITIDSLAFSRNETPMPITAFPGLRVVRVRDSQGHQTPEWYAQAGDEQGFSGGLFRMGERIFASTCNPPQQFKFNRNLSKISSWSNKNGKWSAPAPEKSVWNPGLLELTVAGIQPDDEIWTWAALTHELRSVALHYDEALGLPLPLHLAKQMEEYVLLIDVDEEVTPE